MDINNILDKFKDGLISKDDVCKEINNYLYMRHDQLVVDTFREKRTGFPEFIYGRSKTLEQLIEIAELYLKKELNFICTGVNKYKMGGLKKKYPNFEYIENASFVRHIVKPIKKVAGSVSIVTGGLSDQKVALECCETLNSLNVSNMMLTDVGIAGIHRLLSSLNQLEESNILVVVAGMEGALPSILAGVTYKPVIAVPTSIGYGASNNGFTPLFSMLSSCANGLTVVNIDNGFGAAIAAYRILYTYNLFISKEINN
jgi:NCAIR mutase (PurE)-related protein